MRRLISIALFFTVAIFFVTTNSSYSQVDQEITQEMSDELMNQSKIKGPLEFKGTVKELSKKLKGAIITLYESPDGSHDNLTEIFKTTSPGSGQFEFKAEINKFYVLSVEKGGYTTKKVDIDTDVTLAREQHTSVPKFEFEVDMVKDLDGLGFVGSVANVFYQLKTNKFDYELDYSKEEMEDEERERRERKEKERLAQLAYEKKKELEEAAKLLLDKENATAQQLIEAAITVGDGDKEKTVKGFLEVFPEVDTLREKKALAMYDRLMEERKRTSATGDKINFQSIFNAAKALEEKVVAAKEEERQAKVAVLREEQEEAEKKAKEAMAIQQKAIEEEAREKLASAIAEEELKRAKEEKEKRDKVYYAIFESNGDSETAIQNLVKTYPKGDPYKEEKAKAIYAEYEKTRLTGTTLSNMDFSKLFAAASAAEQEAISKEISADNEKNQSKLDAFMAKVEERKREEQEQTIAKIEEGLKGASKDRASQIDVFENALPKNDPYKEQKAEAMYDQYVQQQGAVKTIQERLKSVPKDKKSQLDVFYNALPEETENRRETAQKMYDNYVASVVFQKTSDPTSQVAEEKLIEESLPANIPGKEQIAKAIYKSGATSSGSRASRQQQIDAIVKNLPANTANRQEVAEEIYETYAQKKQAQGGTGTVALDFASLFGAADQAADQAREEEKAQNAIEKRKAQEQLEARREDVREQKRELAQQTEKEVVQVHNVELAKAKNKKERNLANALEQGAGDRDRDRTVSEIKKVLPSTNDKQLDEERANAVYDAYLKEKSSLQNSGNTGGKINYATLFEAADNAELARLEKQFQQKEAEREKELAVYEEQRTEKLIEVAQAQQKQAEKDAEAAEIAYEETLHKVEAQRQERLAQEQKEKEELAKQIAMERAKREAEEKERADEIAARVAAEKEERLAKEREEQDRLAAIAAEQQRKAEEAAQREVEEQLALLEKQKREAEEARRKQEEAERKEAERLALAKQKEEEAAKKAAADQLAMLEKQKEAERKEAERLALAEQKAEQKRLEEERKAKEAADLAEAKRLEDERKAKEAAEIAEAKRLEEERKAEEQRLADLAKQEKEEAERQRRAQYDKLISEGDAATAKNDVRTAWKKYNDALAMYPDEKDASQKFKTADADLKVLEKEEAEQLALDQKYQNFMSEAEQELAQNNYDAAKDKFQKASDLKPSEQEPKQKIKSIDRTLDQLAAEEKARQDEERKYVLTLQEAAKALESDNLEVAREKYEAARDMKPDDQVPVDKLNEIADREEQLALAAAEQKRKEDEAKRKFEEDQAAEQKRKEEEAERLRTEREARLAALGEVEDAKNQQSLSIADQEKLRIERFEQLKQSLEEIDLSEEERRQAFLSELARIYPEGVTKETVQGNNFVLLRHVVNQNNKVTIYEKKTWDWGGVFYFKDSDIAITQAIYELEIGKY